MDDVPTISVVIASYNQAQTIKSCLQSVLKQKTKVKYEVIVVDSSSNGAYRIAKSFVPHIKLIRRNRRTSWGKGRNIGIDASKGRIIAFTDTDCIVSDKWIENIYRAHKSYHVVGGPVLNGNPWNIFGWILFFMEFVEFTSFKTRIVSNLPGCNTSYKRSVFSKYGYFPANQWSGLFDDFLFNAQIKEKILYSKDITVAHINKTNFFHILKHAFEHGRVDAIGRKTSTLPGQFLFKYKFLIPLLLFYRYLAIGYRALRSKHFLIFILSSPLLLICLLSWTLGFFKGALK